MSFWGDKNKNQDGFHVVLEILDESINFYIFVVKGDNYGELVKTSLKHRISPSNGLTDIETNKFVEILTKGFANLGQGAISRLGKKKNIKVESATVVFFCPWFTTDKKENIRIGKTGQENLISKKTIEEALKTYSTQDRLIETSVDYLKLNGYNIIDPIGKKAENAILSAYFYSISAKLIELLIKEIRFHTSVEPKIMTLPKACALYAYRHSLKLPTLFVCVENETTCICLLRESSFINPLPVYSVQSIDLGLNQITRNVMEKSGAEKEVALSYMRLLDEGLLSASAANSIKSAVYEVLKDWKNKMQYALKKSAQFLDLSGNKKRLLCRELKFNDIFIKTLNENLKDSESFEAGTKTEQVVFESSLYNV